MLTVLQLSAAGWHGMVVFPEHLPAEVLIEASEDADLLVLGSRGTGGFPRLLMGLVSSQLTHHAHCPVVIVPADRRS